MAESTATALHTVTLEGIRHEYGEVFTYALRPDGPLPFRAGQHMHLLAPGMPLEKPNVRHMSLASAPHEGLLQVSMDLASRSPYKEAFRRAQIGQTTQVFKVGGEFVLGPGDLSPLVFVAGGIGITPFRSLVRQLEREGRPRSWSLLHVSRDAFLYQEELSALPFPQHRVGRPELGGVLSSLVESQPKALYYLCGSRGFVEGLAAAVQGLGISPAQCRTEDFR